MQLKLQKTAPILLIACLISDTIFKQNFPNSRTKMTEKIYKIEVETCKKSGRIEFALSRPILNHDEKQKLQLLLADYEKKREISLTREIESRIYCILTDSIKNSFEGMLHEITEENKDVQAHEKKEKWRRNRKRKRKNKDEHPNGKRKKSCLNMTINRKNSSLFTTLYG
jgi:hypothetical protein